MTTETVETISNNTDNYEEAATVEAEVQSVEVEEDVMEEDGSEQLRRSNSNDLILDLVPAPVETVATAPAEPDQSETKSKKVVKKERSQTTIISEAKSSCVTSKNSTKSVDNNLKSCNLIKSVKPGLGNKNTSKKGSSALRANGASEHVDSNNSIKATGGRNNNARTRSSSPSKKSVEKKTLENGGGKSAKIRSKTSNKDELLYSNGENKENLAKTASSVKGGFLAPTKSWLLYMGNQVDLKSRSPSPGINMKERSPSPRRRLRESSSESETNRLRKSSVGAGARKVVEKDPKLPIVKRTNSMIKKTSINGDAKGEEKSAKDLTSVNGRRTKRDNLTQKRQNSFSGENNKNLVEKQASASSESSNQTKLPPPVAPKPVIQNSSNNNEKKKVDASSINTSESAQVNGSRSSEESCVEEKSISASQVIHKIETQTRHSQQSSVSSNLFQVCDCILSC